MNQMRFVALCVAVSLGCFSMAFAVDLEDPSKAPPTYVKMVKQGDQTVPVFDTTTHSYSAVTFNKVMGALWMHIDAPQQGASHVCQGGQKRWQGDHRLRRDRSHVQSIISRPDPVSLMG